MSLAALLVRPLELLVPQACAACALPGPALCAGCHDALRPLTGPCCAGCGAPAAQALARCAECRGPIQGGRQAFAYEHPLPAILSALKDGRRRALAATLGALVAAHVPPPAPEALLVPVPLGRRRARERGFNQSLLLARDLGRRWGLPVGELVVRTREGPPQRGAGASARVRQVARAFAPAPGARPAARVVLVDDVRTTGATLAACARALRAAGAGEVGAICVGRA